MGPQYKDAAGQCPTNLKITFRILQSLKAFFFPPHFAKPEPKPFMNVAKPEHPCSNVSPG